MKNYKVDTAFNLAGNFWTPDQPNDSFTGFFSSEGGKTALSVSPTFARLNDPLVLRSALMSMNDNEPQTIRAVCGLTKEGPCTLLNLFGKSDEGVTNVVERYQLSAKKYDAQVAVIGMHLDSFEAKSVESAAFYFTKIHNWLPAATEISLEAEKTTVVSHRRAREIFRFKNEQLKAEIICEVFSSAQTKVRKSTSIKSVHRIRIVPESPQSFLWFNLLAFRIENYFALFLGTSVGLERLQLFRKDEAAWAVQKVRYREEKSNRQLLIACPIDKAAQALDKWLSVAEEKRPVELTVLGMIRNSTLAVQTEFLSLAQALEAFGRLHFDKGLISNEDFKKGLATLKQTVKQIWGQSEISTRSMEALSHANESSYAQRLHNLYDMLSAEFAAELLGEREEFTRRVVQTRNYFTHLGIRKGQSVISDEKPLFLLNQRLHALIRCVMLLDLGLSEDEIRKQIMYQAQRWR